MLLKCKNITFAEQEKKFYKIRQKRIESKKALLETYFNSSAFQLE
jgi:hypothetical protein